MFIKLLKNRKYLTYMELGYPITKLNYYWKINRKKQTNDVNIVCNTLKSNKQITYANLKDCWGEKSE